MSSSLVMRTTKESAGEVCSFSGVVVGLADGLAVGLELSVGLAVGLGDSVGGDVVAAGGGEDGDADGLDVDSGAELAWEPSVGLGDALSDVLDVGLGLTDAGLGVGVGSMLPVRVSRNPEGSLSTTTSSPTVGVGISQVSCTELFPAMACRSVGGLGQVTDDSSSVDSSISDAVGEALGDALAVVDSVGDSVGSSGEDGDADGAVVGDGEDDGVEDTDGCGDEGAGDGSGVAGLSDVSCDSSLSALT